LFWLHRNAEGEFLKSLPKYVVTAACWINSGAVTFIIIYDVKIMNHDLERL
jgi:hypothetical protein